MNTKSNHNIVAPSEWLAARKELLAEEKRLTRQMDALSAKRRALPWVKVEKDYQFETRNGRVSLAELFGGRSQLVIQHFMLGPGWGEGCKSCSYVADHLAPAVVHLHARDVAFAAISHAPMSEITPFKERMGWSFNWVSSHGTDFNHDYQVSFAPEDLAKGKVYYNY